MLLDHPLTVIDGRAPANARVVPILSIKVPLILVVENLIVVGLLTATTWAIGNASVPLLPTVYVSGPQDAMRLSVGCMRSWLSALRKPVGRPLNSPIRQTVLRVPSVEAMVPEAVVEPAETVTDFVATLSSSLYKTMV